jgi:outer membrane protein W
MRAPLLGLLLCALTSATVYAAPVADDDSDDEAEKDEPAGKRADTAEADKPVDRAPSKPRPRAAREWFFRAGIAHVEPRIASGGMQIEPAGITRLVPMPPVKGGIETSPTNVFTAILGVAPATFRGYLAFETLIGIPKSAKLRATGDLANMSLAPTALDVVPTGIPPLGSELGEASAAPLMVTAVARTPPIGGRVRAYVGGGPSVLIVRNARVTNPVLTEVATPKIEISPAVGFVGQIGVDVQLYKRVYARLDIKEMWFQESESRISNIHVKTSIPLLDTVDVGSATSRVKANPLVVQFGIGASF